MRPSLSSPGLSSPARTFPARPRPRHVLDSDFDSAFPARGVMKVDIHAHSNRKEGLGISLVTRFTHLSMIRIRVIATVLTVSVLFGIHVFGSGSAYASSFRCVGYGIGLKFGKISSFCGETIGRGTYLETVGAGFSAPVAWAGWLNNTRVRVELIDNSGTTYWSSTSSLQSGGSAVGAWKWRIDHCVRSGHVKYVLLSNGAEIATVTSSIS